MRAQILAAVLLTATTVATTAVATGSLDAATPPGQRVVMFADSVGLGARTALPQAFPADWAVRVDGQPARFVEQIEHDFVRPRLATNPDWFGDHVVIAAGYNYPYWDPERFERSIDSLITTLTNAGVDHVYWVTLREVKPQYISPGAWIQVQPYYWYFPAVNDHLEAALARHPNLRLVDWAAVADRTGLTYDAIHLNTTGAALYSQIVRNAVDAATTAVADESTVRVTVPGAGGHDAAVVNITTTDPRRNGHLRLWNCDGDPPTVSMHSYDRAQTVAHSGLAPLNDEGEFCVFARTSTNLVIDVSATFIWTDLGDLADPARLFDTRPGARLAAGATTELAIADDASPVALTVTALGGSEPGWVRVIDCDRADTVTTANLNHPAGPPTPNLVLVRPDADGRVCLVNRTDTHLVVDRFAVFDDASVFDIDTPERWLDTREHGAPLPAGSATILELTDLADVGAVVDPSTEAVIVNITSVGADGPGYVTAYPCNADRPTAANLNTAGGVVSNAAIVAVDSEGSLCLYNRSAMHLVVDLMGVVGGDGFVGRTPERLLDTRG